MGSKRKYTEKAIAVPPQSCASYVERKSYVTLRRPTSTSLTKSHTHVLDEEYGGLKQSQKSNGANTEHSRCWQHRKRIEWSPLWQPFIFKSKSNLQRGVT